MPLDDFRQKYLEMYKGKVPDTLMKAEYDGKLTRYSGNGKEGFWYTVFLNAPEPNVKQLEALIEKEIEVAKLRGRRVWWWKIHEFPSSPQLSELLEKYGFEAVRTSRLMYCSADNHVSEPPGIEVQEVKTASELDSIKNINEAVWESSADWITEMLSQEIARPSSLTRAYLAKRVGGAWVSSGWVKFYNQVAFLFGGTTLADARGHGAYRALLGVRLKIAAKNQMSYVATECSPESEKILLSLGFLDAGQAVVYEKKNF